MKVPERGLAHHAEHVVGRVLRGDLQATGDVVLDQFVDVALVALLLLPFGVLVQEQVVADAARHERVIHPGRLAHRLVDVEERRVIRIEVAAHVGPDAARADAFVADPLLLALHLVHVRRRPADVGDRAAKIRHLLDLLNLAQNRRLAATRDEFPLVRGDRTEAAPAKTPAVHVDRVLDHLVRGDRSTLAILRVQIGRAHV